MGKNWSWMKNRLKNEIFADEFYSYVTNDAHDSRVVFHNNCGLGICSFFPFLTGTGFFKSVLRCKCVNTSTYSYIYKGIRVLFRSTRNSHRVEISIIEF